MQNGQVKLITIFKWVIELSLPDVEQPVDAGVDPNIVPDGVIQEETVPVDVEGIIAGP